METSLIIIAIGLVIFLGHYLEDTFERKSIPDVLGLIFIGFILGPVLHIIDANSFGQFSSLFSSLVLIFILFESGTDLKFADIKASFRESAGITIVGYLLSWALITATCKIMFQLPFLTCLFLGAALGGTSSAVVVGLVKKIKVRSKTSTALIVESAETDVFTLAIPITILTLMTTGQMEVKVVLSRFVASLVIALVMGIGGAFLWSFILNKFPTLKSTKFSTPAFLFILYGLAEYLRFSGPLTALSFGITIGNLQEFSFNFLKWFQIEEKDSLLPPEEKDFLREIVFLMRTFFFILIGLSIQINRMDWFLAGILFTAILFLLRLIIVRFLISKETPLLDKAVISFMIPRGLGAAVIGTLPVQAGHADGEFIRSICYSVILFSTIFCVILFFLAKTGISIPFYKLIYPTAPETETEKEKTT